MNDLTPRTILIVGPTAGGKSDLALQLADRLGGEIVGADSMQVYRQLDAGTAKPSPAERQRAAHHLIDIVEPTERFTVADWLTRARATIAEIAGRGRVPIVVGGTNLYIQSLLPGMFEGPAGDAALREKLSQLSRTEMHDRLRQVDPAAAERIHINDTRRMIRALEVFELTGRPISDWQRQWSGEGEEGSGQVGKWPSGQVGEEGRGEGSGRGAKWPSGQVKDENASAVPDSSDTRPLGHSATRPLLLGLAWPTERINRRINLRVKAMFYPDRAREQDGLDWWVGESLVDETRRLEAMGVLGPQAREALGYKQVLDHLAGRCTEDEAFERTKILTRRFAKQQRTWLRRFRDVHWLDAVDRAPEALLEAALSAMDAASA